MGKDYKKYNHREIEEKWKKIWEEKQVNSVKLKEVKNPFYNLMMYPYPSAEGLHVGHVLAFSGADIQGRYQKMKGYDVFEPIGFDSGGIHSENYAIKIGDHPKKSVKRAIANFSKQLKNMGNMYDWNHTVDVMDPDYYKWTQWIFIKLFKAGLAYKKPSFVTWCPSCKTTLSDEQTETEGENTVCERCKTQIERKKMSQWFLNITKYAERLLNNTEKLNWPNKILATQRNWIGKSEGAEINFRIKGSEEEVKIFTTRPDTLYGCSFFVLAPEHPLVEKLCTEENKQKVDEYIKQARGKTEQDRKIGDKGKTGIFTGGYVINPVNRKEVPVWVADYVLLSYGEGAVMGVPGHDERDFLFAQKYGLEIVPVIDIGIPYDSKNWKEIYHEKGVLINSESWNGKNYPEDLKEIIEDLEMRGIGKRKITYKLRDWCISRQRYWGPPIPMIYCEECKKKGLGERKEMPGWYCHKEEELPLLLPDLEDFLPDGSGKSPLYRDKEFLETKCPVCGGKAIRETDVSDTFLDSSWYFLRYPSTAGGDVSKEESERFAFIPEITKKWLPVSQYCGGAEHAVLHLMYSRFITMALHDIGELNFDEPFPNFYAHGLIIKDGAKMSKSRGNVVNPDEYIERYGADSLRLYLSFMGPYADGGDFRDSGMMGIKKFINRLWRVFEKRKEFKANEEDKELENIRQITIKKVEDGINRFKYNTSIAGLMEYVNYLEELIKKGEETKEIASNFGLAIKTLIILCSPFIPFITEEMWSQFEEKESEFVSLAKWPEYEEQKIFKEKIKMVIQVNGKLRDEMEIEMTNIDNQELILSRAKARGKIMKFIEGKEIRKEILIKGKLVNIVV